MEVPSLPSPAIEPPRILIVCTANQCRSAMAEGLLRARLADRGIAATVGSAGLLPGGIPATELAVAVLADRGLDITGHRSRELVQVDGDVVAADLVVTMERRHLQEIVLAHPELRSRSFTLVDLVRRAEAADARRSDESIRAWAGRLAAERMPADILGIGDDAVADPIGQPRSRYEATATLLDDLVTRLVAAAWPTVAADPAGARAS